MVERQVIGTIPVGRQVLLVTGVPIAASSELHGKPLDTVNEDGQVRVIAVERPGDHSLDWVPAPTYQLAPQDRLIVVATGRGLGQIWARSLPTMAA
jgi:Trk K+ transport system NAD-binding subunit